MQAVEDPEESVGVLHIKTRPVVFYIIYYMSAFRIAADLDHSFSPVSRKFYGIGYKIVQDLPDQGVVAESGRKPFPNEFEISSRMSRLQFIPYFLEQLSYIQQ